MKLTKEAQAKARQFIQEQGRPLEQARYHYHFANGPAEAVLTALATFQNEDGGFGHALEPDMRLPQSSVLATSVGLQILVEVGATADQPLVQAAMRYLLHTYDEAQQVWPLIPRHTNEHPHAPWWHDDGTVAQRFGGFLANPRAEIVGYLFTYAELVPTTLAQELAQAIVTHLEAAAPEVDMHDLACYVETAENPHLPPAIRAALLPPLRQTITATVSTDPATWGQYGLKPLAIISSPESPFAPLLSEALEANLDDTITRQQADGAWSPAWSWGDAFPEVWPQAKQEWAGVLTLKTLRQLKNFGRLA